MPGESNNTFFTQFGKYLSPQTTSTNTTIPFNEHPQFSILVDILSRKDNHHAILQVDFAPKMYVAFFEAFLQHLNTENIPELLRGTNLVLLDIFSSTFSPAKQKSIVSDFEKLRDYLDKQNKLLLIALTRDEILNGKEDDFLRVQFESLLAHPRCRFMVMSKTKDNISDNDHFFTVKISGPTETDILTLLNQQRTELESYHHVIIPDDILPYAYGLAERYLSTNNTLEKTLLLLDSSSARASTMERMDNDSQIKPVLTINTLTTVLTNWTQIPASHLQLNKFKLSEFKLGMQQRIFGQETAINIIGHELQQAQARLQQKYAPFCSFLFAGPIRSGKETTALALVDQLFKQLNVLYYIQTATPSLNSLADIKVQRCLDKQYLSLKDVIRQTPYAVFIVENIEHATTVVLDGLHEILTTGYLHDISGAQYNFRQSIFILTTALGSQNLFDIAKSLTPEIEDENVDLMQLVMNEKKHSSRKEGRDPSTQEMIEAIMPDIISHFPISFCQQLHIVPFLPLNHLAIEKILRLKLKALGKQLDTRYGIEFAYAPEIVRFLANDILNKQEEEHQIIDTDTTIKQLYFTVEQSIVSQADNKNRSNQLFLQLNETGQMLRCDWLGSFDHSTMIARNR